MPLILPIKIATVALTTLAAAGRNTVSSNVAAALEPESPNVSIDPPQVSVSHIAIGAVLGITAIFALSKIKDL